jgi:hypothetical protein
VVRLILIHLVDQLLNLHFTVTLLVLVLQQLLIQLLMRFLHLVRNYTAGGNTLTNNGVAVSSNVAFVDFADSTFSSVTLSATGALIYKGSSNEAVLVLDFGGTKTATNGDFVVQFPTADSSNAIIRLGDA